MPNDSEKLTRIGIECESIEGQSWGVGRFLYKTLEQISLRPQLAHTHRFYLYFKKRVPDYPFLKAPMFVTCVTTPPGVPASFNFHYHVWMVARAYWDGIAMLFFPNYQLPLLWFKKSLVMLTEDVWYEMRNPKLPFRHRLSYAIFSNWAAWAATRVMAISHTSAGELKRLFGIRPSRIVINELAVDPPRTVHGATRTRPYLLYVGQAFERRHLRETIRAFEKIAPTFPGLQLVIVGPDKYRPPIIVPSSDIVRFDHVSDHDLAVLYTNAATIAYVSDMEAFGLPPLEALAYGTPAVVADKPISHELFGDAAFFVREPNSADSIADTLRDALSNTAKREQIRAAAPAILARYTWAAHADRFLRITNEILYA